jgi:hypothetical protein
MRKGSNALYPNLKKISLLQSLLQTIFPSDSTLGPLLDRYATLREANMKKLYENDSDIYPILLVGGSYTFEKLGTLTMEYMYHAPVMMKLKRNFITGFEAMRLMLMSIWARSQVCWVNLLYIKPDLRD